MNSYRYLGDDGNKKIIVFLNRRQKMIFIIYLQVGICPHFGINTLNDDIFKLAKHNIGTQTLEILPWDLEIIKCRKSKWGELNEY